MRCRTLCSLLAVLSVLPAAHCAQDFGEVQVETILGKDAAGWAKHLQSHDRPEERQLAVYCLGEFGPAAAESVGLLLQAADDPLDEDLRKLAVDALGQIGPAARAAAPRLMQILRDSEAPAGMRRAACEALGRIAPGDAAAASAILGALQAHDEKLRHAAIDATLTVVLETGSGEAVEGLIGRLNVAEDAERAAQSLLCLGDRAVAPLREALRRGRNAAVRLAAVQTLARLGERARPAQADLIRVAASEREEAHVRREAIVLLEKLGATGEEALRAFVAALARDETAAAARSALAAAGAPAVPLLTAQLNAREAALRHAGAEALGGMGAHASGAINALAERLNDSDAAVRRAAAEALGRLGPVAASAREALSALARRTAETADREAFELAAANVARPAGSPPLESPFELLTDARLRETLGRDPLPARRAEAARLLGGRTEDPKANAAALLAGMRDTDPEVRATSARSLGAFGKEGVPALPTLVDWLGDKDVRLRKAALVALAGIPDEDNVAMLSIVALAKSDAGDQDEELRKLIAGALHAQGPRAAPWLANVLAEGDEQAARRAARYLEGMGPHAAGAWERVLEAAKNAESNELAAAALDALGAMGEGAAGAAPALAEMLADPRAVRRSHAALALTGLGRLEELNRRYGLVALLAASLMDPDEGVCRSAHTALARIGEPALPALREIVRLSKDEVPFWVLRVMALLKADAETVIAGMLKMTLPGKRPIERANAAELVGLYAPEHKEMIPFLVRCLGDRTGYVTIAAETSLKLFGREAIPELERALAGRHPRRRLNALKVLEAIRAEPKP